MFRPSIGLLWIVIVVVMSTSGCGNVGSKSNSRPKLVGKWEGNYNGLPMEFEFRRDGRVIMTQGLGPLSNSTITSYEITRIEGDVVYMSHLWEEGEAYQILLLDDDTIEYVGRGVMHVKLTRVQE